MEEYNLPRFEMKWDEFLKCGFSGTESDMKDIPKIINVI